MRIRTRLLLLVLAVLIPALLCAGLAISYAYVEHQGAHRKTMQETARALALVLDGELARREEVLRILAASPALEDDDFDSFYRHAQPIAAAADVAIFLSTADGTQLVNTRLPFGAPLPRMLPMALQMRAAAGPSATVISDLYEPPVGLGHSFAVQVPVWRKGEVRYYLGMGSYARDLQAIFEKQGLPADWLGGIIDRQGVIVARSHHPQRYVGTSVGPRLRGRLADREGALDGLTLGGEPATAYFGTAPRSRWMFYVAVPRGIAQEGALRAAAWMAAATFALLALAVLAAFAFARRTVRPIEALRDVAHRLGRGEPAKAPRSSLVELDTVGQALEQADARLRAAHAEQERRIAEAVERAARSQRALLHAQKLEALGRLTGGIAHDFNNILQTLSTGVDLAQHRSHDEVARTALERCRRAIQRASELTRQLAVFGRRQEARLETIDPARRLEDARPLLAGSLPANIRFEMQIDGTLWPVCVDPLQLELALLNLCLNARDAMPGGGVLMVQASNQRLERPLDDLAAGDYLRLSVRDQGAGMAPDVLARAIDPFYTTKPVGQGSGMGLPQAYGFARQSGGTLVLDSAPGRGTEVSLYLPRAGLLPSEPRQDAEAQARRAQGERVLLVEDDPLVREVVERALEEAGFTVVACPDADSALQVLERLPAVDALFSDIVMPGSLSGIELAERVKERYPQTFVLLASGYSERAGTMPNVRTLAKPYALSSAVDALLDGMSLRP